MTLTDLLYAGKEEHVGKWWLAQCAHGVYMLTVHTSRDAYNTTTILEYHKSKYIHQ